MDRPFSCKKLPLTVSPSVQRVDKLYHFRGSIAFTPKKRKRVRKDLPVETSFPEGLFHGRSPDSCRYIPELFPAALRVPPDRIAGRWVSECIQCSSEFLPLYFVITLILPQQQRSCQVF